MFAPNQPRLPSTLANLAELNDQSYTTTSCVFSSFRNCHAQKPQFCPQGCFSFESLPWYYLISETQLSERQPCKIDNALVRHSHQSNWVLTNFILLLLKFFRRKRELLCEAWRLFVQNCTQCTVSFSSSSPSHLTIRGSLS